MLEARSEQGLPAAPKWERYKLTLQRNSVNPIKDDDNQHGAWKPVIDALVFNEIVADDTMENIVEKKMSQVKVTNRCFQESIIKIEPVTA